MDVETFVFCLFFGSLSTFGTSTSVGPKELGPLHVCESIDRMSAGLAGAAVLPYDRLGVWGGGGCDERHLCVFSFQIDN